MALLRVEDLVVEFRPKSSWNTATAEPIRALDGVSFEIAEGQRLGIVGDAGAGKTTLALATLKILRPASGAIHFLDRPILRMPEHRFRRLRGDLQMIYAHPEEAFRPGWTIRRLFTEGLRLHQRELSREERRTRMNFLLESVGLDPDCTRWLPAQMNLFDQQRLCIARTLAAQPRLLVCDDPTRYLDTLSQARILDLLRDLQVHWRMTLLYLSRDYAAAEQMSEFLHIINRGQVVESGTPEALFHGAAHEYTRRLLALSGAP